MKQILIDAGSSVNLITEFIVSDLNIPRIPDQSLAIKVANGKIQQLDAYVRIKVVIASVERLIEAYVVPGSAMSYHLLLSRQWLRDVKAIGDYATDDYWITDRMGNMHQLVPTASTVRKPITIPRVTLSAQVEPASCRLDEDTMNDLVEEDEDVEDHIWDEIIREAEEEDWVDDEYDTNSEGEESGKEDRW
jgi:hypothetical protein